MTLHRISGLLLVATLLGIIGSILIWMAAGGIGPRSPFWQGLLYLLLALTLPLSLAIAILRCRLWNIEVIINRTLVYGLLTASLALVYFGGVALLQQGFSSESPIVIVVSTLFTAALFAPCENGSKGQSIGDFTAGNTMPSRLWRLSGQR